MCTSDRAQERLRHNDTLQQVTCCRKKKTKKKSCHDENVHVGLIHLTSPSASCLAADPSQFVFRKAQKEVLLGHFGKAHGLSSACMLPGQPPLG